MPKIVLPENRKTQHDYYEKHKQLHPERNEKITCEICKSVVQKSNMKQHLKTKVHMRFCEPTNI